MSSRKTITLSQLQRQVKQTLTEQFALPVWVSAEISELKVNYAGHCYLELIEKGEEDAVPKAQARATIWRNRYPHVSSYFEAETGQPLTAGIRILAQVLVSYHELYGFSLQINDIDPAFTLGEMERQKNATIRRLQEEGVWEMNRQVELPAVVQRLAVVSSAKAAGFQDFINELKKSRYAFQTTLFEAVMQGLSAEESIIDALGRVADRMEQFDAVVIVRGGGSQSDLSCFNAYRLSNHVAQFPLPVLTGIGHDKDQSVVDMVAASPHKTPTAVAAWLVERMANLEGWLEGAATQLHETTLRHLREAALSLERMSSELHRTTKETLLTEQLKLNHHASQLPERVADFLARQRMRLEQAEKLTESRSPRHILQLGFAIVRSEGRVLKTTSEVAEAHSIEIELNDGTINLKH
ncbi:MAG: exodeoxyribonuclease VII large subunit [Alistipes sp.]|nr:exodeoxyribonuclease VII large subunit [Alistipes sp.]